MSSRFASGLRLAVTTFTVLPLRPGRIDRPAAAVAMALAPAVGAALGALLGAALLGLAALSAPPLVAGAAVVGLGALLTRSLHLDGLADTVDALGSHKPPAAALEIMKKPDVGPFGVVALSVVLLLQAASLAAQPPPGRQRPRHGGRRHRRWAARGELGMPAWGSGGSARRAGGAGRRHRAAGGAGGGHARRRGRRAMRHA